MSHSSTTTPVPWLLGPDGKLYVAVGDGGSADDQPDADMQLFLGIAMVGHGEIGNGQNPGTILGSILRIDPAGDNSPNGEYGVPAGNPFFVDGPTVGGEQGCEDGLCDEIFAFGFRNPYRFSFDMKTGFLYAADVGQNDIEEVDIVMRGGNLNQCLLGFGQDARGNVYVLTNDTGTPSGVTGVVRKIVKR